MGTPAIVVMTSTLNWIQKQLLNQCSSCKRYSIQVALISGYHGYHYMNQLQFLNTLKEHTAYIQLRFVTKQWSICLPKQLGDFSSLIFFFSNPFFKPTFPTEVVTQHAPFPAFINRPILFRHHANSAKMPGFFFKVVQLLTSLLFSVLLYSN